MTEESTQIIDMLKELGLTQYESQVYAALFQLKYATIHELHTLSGVPRNKIYETLDSLVAKEFATVIDTNPLKYAQTEIEKTFSSLRKKELEKLDRIEAFLEEQEMTMGLFRKSFAPHAYELHSRIAIESHLQTILRQTRKELYIGVADPALFSRLFPKPLLKKLEKKIAIQVILFNPTVSADTVEYPCRQLKPEFFTKMKNPDDDTASFSLPSDPHISSKLMMISDRRTLLSIDDIDHTPSGNILLMKHTIVLNAMIENLQAYFIPQ